MADLGGKINPVGIQDMNRAQLFNEDYYEHGEAKGISCYTNYHWLPEMTVPMARALAANLGLRQQDWILDFGCAKGFLVKAFRVLGFANACGADISEYAISHGDEMVKPFLHLIPEGSLLNISNGGRWGWIIAKDVLEHLTEPDVAEVLKKMREACENLFFLVPLGGGNKYVIPEVEHDVTHIVRRPLDWWAWQCYEAGFASVTRSYKMPGIKENPPHSLYPAGNGFVIAKR